MGLPLSGWRRRAAPSEAPSPDTFNKAGEGKRLPTRARGDPGASRLRGGGIRRAPWPRPALSGRPGKDCGGGSAPEGRQATPRRPGRFQGGGGAPLSEPAPAASRQQLRFPLRGIPRLLPSASETGSPPGKTLSLVFEAGLFPQGQTAEKSPCGRRPGQGLTFPASLSSPQEHWPPPPTARRA